MKRHKLHHFIRKIHRYAGLFLGIQLILWTAGGIYFSWTQLPQIRGEHLIRPQPFHHPLPKSLVPIDSAIKRLPPSSQIARVILQPCPYGWCYLIQTTTGTPLLLDAHTAKPLPPLDSSTAIQIAKAYFLPEAKVHRVRYIDSSDVHRYPEYRERPLPAWRIQFDHPEHPALYINTHTHALEVVRTRPWRIFDFMWMLHTMDYRTRDNFNNPLLRITALSTLLFVLTGFVLWYLSSPTLRKWRKRYLR